MTIRKKICQILPVFGLALLITLNLSAQVLPSSLSIFDGTYRRVQVPIFMYHYVDELPTDADRIRINLTVSPALFRQHLQFFADNGFTSISLHEMLDALTTGSPLPPKPVILSFDDGHLDHYTNVFPMLKEFNMRGTFFIITGFADSNLPDYMNWQQIREMSDAGMEMEAHSITHSELDGRDYDFLVYEILGSSQTLSANLNKPVEFLSYPVGRYDALTLQIIATTPIRAAVTTQLGSYITTDSLYEIPRLRVNNDTGVSGLQWLLNNSNNP
jgi:peptidoglycan/xylan/chitin deacetylase (PgdA/CDA1 family)